MMIGICPRTGETITGVTQLIARVDRYFRTARYTRQKRRLYGTTIRDELGKNNTALRLATIQNNLLTDLHNPVHGLTDFKCSQVKVMPDGRIFFIGEFNDERIKFSI